MRRRLLLALGAGASVGAALLMARRAGPAPHAQQTLPTGHEMPPLVRTVALSHDGAPSVPQIDPAAGLDLTRIGSVDGSSTAPAERGVARLTLDVDLQRTAVALMASRHLPEAAIVVMDAASGRLFVYASHVEVGRWRDLCAEASAPSASVFKIVTAAALVEDAHLGPETKQCYLGGEQRILPIDLVDDPQRDKWCTTLAGAMGRSINTVFARLAKEHLEPTQLDAMARRFGFGQPLPFDVPVKPSVIHVPEDPLEFARTAAGFWNSTLSPLQAAEISAIVARGGETVRPVVVDKIVSDSGAVVWSAPESPPASRAIARDTADKLATMMEHTITEGTSFRAFHDARALPFLPGIGVAGKTGTLTDGAAHRYYTWFTGFAPSKPMDDLPQVAVAVLVVNGPTWQVKANVIAREILRAYFASHEVKGVTRPSLSAIARHKRER
jgi:peptidoglycan glycosyltransferase